MKNIYRSFLLMAAAALVLPACKTTQTLLPNVSGKAGEIVVVMDKTDWEGNLGTATRELLASDCPYLAQREPLYSLAYVTPTGFIDMFKIHRNILIFNIDQNVQQPGVLYRSDVWSHPQCAIQINAALADSALTLLKANGERILSTFEQAERDRVIANSKQYENASLAPPVKELTGGGSPHFPTGYNLKKKTDDFIWIADEKQYIQGILIYKYPAAEHDNFTIENIVAHRNEILEANVPGMFENTWMTTSDYVIPTLEFIRYRGRQFAQTRGFWEVHNDYMGGPFVSHSFYSKDNRYIIVLEGFVYAPQFDKRQFLRQVESILYSFEWDEDKN